MLDTNVVVSSLLWRGKPSQIWSFVTAGDVQLVSSEALIAEFQDVISRAKFAKPLATIGASGNQLIALYRGAVELVNPSEIPAVIQADPDDDHVLACALAAGADAVVTGDPHLLSHGPYEGIAILSPAQFVDQSTNR